MVVLTACVTHPPTISLSSRRHCSHFLTQLTAFIQSQPDFSLFQSECDRTRQIWQVDSVDCITASSPTLRHLGERINLMIKIRRCATHAVRVQGDGFRLHAIEL